MSQEIIILLTEIRDELKKLNARHQGRAKRESVAADGLPEIAKIWNEWAHPIFPRVMSMDTESSRYKNCRKRWEKKPNQEYWQKVIVRLNESSFCRGNNEKKWVAGIEFLCKPDKANEILEGKYDDRKQVDAPKDEKVLLGYWTNPETGKSEPWYGPPTTRRHK